MHTVSLELTKEASWTGTVAGYFIEFVNTIFVHLVILVISVPDNKGLCLKVTLPVESAESLLEVNNNHTASQEYFGGQGMYWILSSSNSKIHYRVPRVCF
jgi:hypothetical protein